MKKDQRQIAQHRNGDAQPGGSRLHTVERWMSLLGGGALAAYGIKRRTLGGMTAAAAGGFLVYRGIRAGSNVARGFHAEASFTIFRPAAELFRYWRDLQNLPKFMYHLDTVRVVDDRHSHWVANAPMGLRISWEAEIVDEKENEWIVWRSIPGSDVSHAGSVYFRPAPADRGTEVTVALQYEPIGGYLGKMVGMLMGRDPQWTVREELRRFKQLMETGEIPTTAGQPSGRRSAVVSLLHSAYENVRPSVQPAGRLA